MNRKLSALAAFAIATMLGTAPGAADEMVMNWATPGWDGGAHRDPNTGEIYCLLWHEYGDGMQIQLGIDSLGYYVVLTDPVNFAFLSDDPFDTPLQVDEYYPTEFEAYANSTHILVVDLASDTAFMQLLASGSRLILAEWNARFGLEGSADAIAALENCYAQRP